MHHVIASSAAAAAHHASMAGTTAPDWIGPAIMFAILLGAILIPALVMSLRGTLHAS